MYEIIWNCLSEFFMIAQPFSSDSFWSLAITERRVKGVMNCTASHSTVTLALVVFFFFAGISERIYNSPVLSRAFKGITCHQETLHVIKCVLSAGVHLQRRDVPAGLHGSCLRGSSSCFHKPAEGACQAGGLLPSPQGVY